MPKMVVKRMTMVVSGDELAIKRVICFYKAFNLIVFSDHIHVIL